MIYPTITLYQPWATWIMRGWKTIETRTHNRFACLKGKTILIHAGMTTDKSKEAVSNPYLSEYQLSLRPYEMMNGFILCKAFVYNTSQLYSLNSSDALIDCEKVERYGLFLSNIEKFEKPIPVKGEMGIWYFDLDKKEKVKKPKL